MLSVGFFIATLNVVMLNVVMLNVVILCLIMPRVVMLSVIMLSVVILNAIAPLVTLKKTIVKNKEREKNFYIFSIRVENPKTIIIIATTDGTII
jgi:hypothetical protein